MPKQSSKASRARPPKRTPRAAKQPAAKRSAKAPAKRAAPARAAPAAAASDLPFIGAPARRALGLIRVTRLSQLVKYSEADLLALHGFGPKAIRLLEQAGVRFRKASPRSF